ncbi:TPA: hypothetical protein N0F65_003630, partial [Lagenidium giganteum]
KSNKSILAGSVVASSSERANAATDREQITHTQRTKMSYAEGTAPRVNKKTMGSYVGRTVALVGAVESHMPTAVVLRTSDGGHVNVKPAPGSDYGSKVVEVIGRVLDSETIQEFKATLFGENFDLESYDQLLQLSQGKFRPLFD